MHSPAARLVPDEHFAPSHIMQYGVATSCKWMLLPEIGHSSKGSLRIDLRRAFSGWPRPIAHPGKVHSQIVDEAATYRRTGLDWTPISPTRKIWMMLANSSFLA